ncbi:hypothetical protein ACKUB1_18115 [Methanospirillum stamsii]|uniref:hypothetical protein n=1 Tax=Methanospirillum stamsii TaxID=1277351 RepID=UPI0015E84095|nr:hypothetical protein [Methanospirillum stamsii]
MARNKNAQFFIIHAEGTFPLLYLVEKLTDTINGKCIPLDAINGNDIVQLLWPEKYS